MWQWLDGYRCLAKVEVAGSNPVIRSTNMQVTAFSAVTCGLFGLRNSCQGWDDLVVLSRYMVDMLAPVPVFRFGDAAPVAVLHPGCSRQAVLSPFAGNDGVVTSAWGGSLCLWSWVLWNSGMGRCVR